MTLCDSVGVLLCFCCVIGITLLVPEGETLSNGNHLELEEGLEFVNVQESTMLLGIITIFLGSWLSASMNVATGALKGVHFTVVVFFNQILGFTIPSIFAIVISFTHEGQPYLSGYTSGKAYIWLFLGGLCAFLS
jgi:hypothetical protein